MIEWKDNTISLQGNLIWSFDDVMDFLIEHGNLYNDRISLEMNKNRNLDKKDDVCGLFLNSINIYPSSSELENLNIDYNSIHSFYLDFLNDAGEHWGVLEIGDDYSMEWTLTGNKCYAKPLFTEVIEIQDQNALNLFGNPAIFDYEQEPNGQFILCTGKNTLNQCKKWMNL